MWQTINACGKRYFGEMNDECLSCFRLRDLLVFGCGYANEQAQRTSLNLLG